MVPKSTAPRPVNAALTQSAQAVLALPPRQFLSAARHQIWTYETMKFIRKTLAGDTGAIAAVALLGLMMIALFKP
jgi:hypothetical protein